MNSPCFQICAWFLAFRCSVNLAFDANIDVLLIPLYRYKVPAGPLGGVHDSGNPRGTALFWIFTPLTEAYTVLANLAYLLRLVHDYAICEQCMTRITGEWFRCVYCAKDLCNDCETVDKHDNTHFYVVFKSSVRPFILLPSL